MYIESKDLPDYINRGRQIVDDIANNLPPLQNSSELIQATYDLLDYFETDPPITKEWVEDRRYNRYGWKNEIPGFIAELISQCNMLEYITGEKIVVVNTKRSQYNEQVDYISGDLRVQVKSARIHYTSNRIMDFEKQCLINTTATHVSIVDIDRRIHQIATVEGLLRVMATVGRDGSRCIPPWEMEEIQAFYPINNESLYN